MPNYLKRWDGGSFVDSFAYRWNGSSWVDVPVMQWNGSAWIKINPITYEKTYLATSSRSYTAAGGINSEPYGSSYLMHGYYSSASGNQRGILLLPISTIRADIASSVILGCSVWLYKQHSFAAAHSMHIGTNTHSSLPATFAGSYSTSDVVWATTTKPQSAWVNLTVAVGERMRDNQINSLQTYNPSAGTSQSTYGYAYGPTYSGGAYCPQFWIKYER